ncbi:unnamed protein product [Kuraishia capsulata CBS 1993]|uniref:FAD dependent oxidoreductase domain-containing protein n=1 Tax=Kuraishia capsulata CBS 1993 TaxID=1382522 RepID=W6MHL1_9ASCO|nr:uncharacterized protein KUCA_T00001185001 [Kuraishia capsulata CBS 1993]CDK25218.1 unnamed protein product [Kuraishia capsulata CBS 1993]
MGKVIVLGAGVVGLSTALELVQRGHEVDIVARHLPGDIDIEYTSPFAGANWSSFAETDEEQEWDKLGYEKLLEIAKTEPGASVWAKRSLNYNREPAPRLASVVKDLRILPENELIPGTHCGFEYTSIVISVGTYLAYLSQKLMAAGVVIRRAHVAHIKDVASYYTKGTPEVIVNCSGLLARKLGGVEDKAVYPIKGQILLIRNNCSTLLSVSGTEGPDEEAFYIFPRKEGGGIIGGSYVPNDWSADISEGFIERTKQKVAKYCPELLEEGPLDIYKAVVGLRPGREGGVRIEKETIPGVGNVVHNYGCGGCGYQNSHGMAIKTAKLVEEFLKK